MSGAEECRAMINYCAYAKYGHTKCVKKKKKSLFS